VERTTHRQTAAKVDVKEALTFHVRAITCPDLATLPHDRRAITLAPRTETTCLDPRTMSRVHPLPVTPGIYNRTSLLLR